LHADGQGGEFGSILGDQKGKINVFSTYLVRDFSESEWAGSWRWRSREFESYWPSQKMAAQAGAGAGMESRVIWKEAPDTAWAFLP
jgi:hypothetical protein